MTDPQAWCFIIVLFLVLALFAWAFYAEMRIQILTGRVAAAEMGAKSAEAKLGNHALGDADLDDRLTKNLGAGTKS